MTRIDRYILFLYIRVLFICFCSIAGMLIVVDVFTNIEEFMQSGREQGSVVRVLVDYYGPKLLAMFEYINGLLALMATMFVISWLYRTNELTALLASGITKRRVIRPIMIASICVILGAMMIREGAIPKLQTKLLRNPQDLSGERPQAVRPTREIELGALIDGRNLVLSNREIVEPIIRLLRQPLVSIVGRQLQAATAKHLRATADHPSGFLLQSVKLPVSIDAIPSINAMEGKPLLMTRKDHSWIAAGECFLVSDLDFDLLRGGSKRYASTFELISTLQSSQMLHGNDLRVQIHSRILRPLIDWTVVLLGIPFVLSTPDRHLFRVAGVCLVLVAGFTAVVLGLNAVGSAGYLLSPFLASWIPLVIFLPWSATKVSGACEA